MKRSCTANIIGYLEVILFSILSFSVLAEPKTYDGKATPLTSTTVKYGSNDGFRGIITYVARPGTILRGPVFDLQNHVVKKGEPLMKMRTNYWRGVVKGKLAVLKSAEANLKNARDVYNRFKQLISKDATTMETFQESESNYFAAIGAREAAESDVDLAKVRLESCVFYSPFDALVEEVYFGTGLCAGEREIAKISQLFPMGIKIKMDRETARKITMETPITVYPCNSDKPVQVFNSKSYLVPDGIMICVNNYPVQPSQIDGKKIPICKVAVSIPYNSYDGKKDDSITVPMSCIVKDEQGHFVWRSANRRKNVTKGINQVITVEKVRIVPEDLKTSVGGNTGYRILKEWGDLKDFDIILKNPPEDLKAGQKVCIWSGSYLFMPDDPVKVKIGE